MIASRACLASLVIVFLVVFVLVILLVMSPNNRYPVAFVDTSLAGPVHVSLALAWIGLACERSENKLLFTRFAQSLMSCCSSPKQPSTYSSYGTCFSVRVVCVFRIRTRPAKVCACSVVYPGFGVWGFQKCMFYIWRGTLGHSPLTSTTPVRLILILIVLMKLCPDFPRTILVIIIFLNVWKKITKKDIFSN